jgi:hypothetical protein
MPFIRSLVFKYHTLLMASILLNSEIMNPYSYYIKKGLVYIAFISPSRHQPFFYLEYTKANTQLFYNIYSIPLNKYIYIYYTLLNSLKSITSLSNLS